MRTRKSKLSPTQERVWLMLTGEWMSAYKIGASLVTLNALVRMGYAEIRYLSGSIIFPRNNIEFRLPQRRD